MLMEGLQYSCFVEGFVRGRLLNHGTVVTLCINVSFPIMTTRSSDSENISGCYSIRAARTNNIPTVAHRSGNKHCGQRLAALGPLHLCLELQRIRS
jgi:hypothetical protein